MNRRDMSNVMRILVSLMDTHAAGLRLPTLILLVLVTGSQAAAPPEAAEGPFEPTWESLKQYRCPEWFRDAKLGIWAVWGPEAVPEQGDWYARNLYIPGHPQYEHHLKTYGHPSKVGYKDIIPLWKGEKWDPDRLMGLYKRAGAKYFCVIAQHHDNFDCWDSKYHNWNSVNMGPRRDIVGDWKKAADKYGLRFGVTEHLGASWNWYAVAKNADPSGPFAGVPYDGADPRYADLYHSGNKGAQGWLENVPDVWRQEWFNRIKDLVDTYKPDLLYSDSGFPFDEVGRRLIAHYYNQSLRDHNGRLEAVYNCKQTPNSMWVQDLERGIMGEVRGEPWQTDTCVGDWYYKRDTQYKSSTTVIQMLVDIVSKNGNLLLNFPPRPDGTLDAQEEKILADMADWMRINGEGIFGTRPWKVYGEGRSRVRSGGFNEGSLKYSARDIRFTAKGEVLYAFALGWPEDGKLPIRSLASAAGRIRTVALLGHDGAIEWSQTADALVVTLPPTKPCDHAFALKITGQDLQPVPVAGETAIAQSADGRVVLKAEDAAIHGDSPQYETGDGKDQIGYWGNPDDYVSWDIQLAKPGIFAVAAEYSCAAGAEGSVFTVAVGSQVLTGTSQSTGSWASYTTARLGQISLDKAGTCTLMVKPKASPPWKAIGLKSVTLTPVNN